MSVRQDLLLIGEIFVDFTLPTQNEDINLRLGGVVHAALGLWAIDGEYSVAAVCPAYLVDNASEFLKCHGCKEFIWLADVNGSPNVMVIGESKELADQAYQDILRYEKSVEFFEHENSLKEFGKCLVFPGKFDLSVLANMLCEDAEISFDIAYDLESTEPLVNFIGRISALITSTSSALFKRMASADFAPFLEELRSFSPACVLLKENRGGSRLFDLEDNQSKEIPALLGETAKSVGVGDVYSAVFVYLKDINIGDACWKPARAATCYARTMSLCNFKKYVQRSFALTVDQMRGLGGTFLPWHDRHDFQIYFAAPDFECIERANIDKALNALLYHNFKVRRPVQENGELKPNSSYDAMSAMYVADIKLLEGCDIVFAVPLGKDPGTLVEIGFALATNKPVITFDPLNENANTMVIAGSTIYSNNLDCCLNGLFNTMSKLRASNK